jgi:hypothetical protein
VPQMATVHVICSLAATYLSSLSRKEDGTVGSTLCCEACMSLGGRAAGRAGRRALEQATMLTSFLLWGGHCHERFGSIESGAATRVGCGLLGKDERVGSGVRSGGSCTPLSPTHARRSVYTSIHASKSRNFVRPSPAGACAAGHALTSACAPLLPPPQRGTIYGTPERGLLPCRATHVGEARSAMQILAHASPPCTRHAPLAACVPPAVSQPSMG